MFRTHNTPKSYTAHNIHNRLLRFDSYRIRHKNAPWTGDRYACVFYNKDLNYADSAICERSNRLKNTRPNSEITVLPVKHPRSRAVTDARKKLLSVLRQTRFPEDRTSGLNPSSKYGSKRGHFLAFGVTKTRKNRSVRRIQGLLTRKNINMNNSRYQTLYDALVAYTEAMHPSLFGTSDTSMYHACIIAKNSQCEWHVDAGNIGPCVITSVGDFCGGELLIDEERLHTSRPPRQKNKQKNKQKIEKDTCVHA